MSNGVGTGSPFGFDVLAGRVMLSSCRAGNMGGTTSQTYGVVAANGSDLAVVGCDLISNAAGPILILTGAAQATLIAATSWKVL